MAAAVEVRDANKVSGNSKPKLYAGRLRLAQIPDRGQIALEIFVSGAVAKGSTIFTDGNPSYDHLDTLGYDHHATVIDGDHEKTALVLPMVHVVFSNLKTWLRGTHHGVSPKHLSSYLNEFTFRFNRRFFPMAAVNSVLGIAMRVAGKSYKNLYFGHKRII